MKWLLIIIVLGGFIIDAAAQEVMLPVVSDSAAPKFTFIIIDNAGSTFGYDIYSGARILIHQPSISGLPGNEGVKNREAAEKVAGLVISKLDKGVMPPSVSVEELKNMKVID